VLILCIHYFFKHLFRRNFLLNSQFIFRFMNEIYRFEREILEFWECYARKSTALLCNHPILDRLYNDSLESWRCQDIWNINFVLGIWISKLEISLNPDDYVEDCKLYAATTRTSCSNRTLIIVHTIRIINVHR